MATVEKETEKTTISEERSKALKMAIDKIERTLEKVQLWD